MMGKIKIYDLAKELGQEPSQLIEVIQRLGFDIKSTTSVLGIEEVRSIREYYRKNKPKTQAAPQPTASKPVSEKRVGATVIRRRAVTPSAATPPEPVEEVGTEEKEVLLEAPVREIPLSEPETEIEQEAAASPSPGEAPVEIQAAPETQPSPEIQKQRRFYPSIIKKVATEQYLGEVIGPKPPEKPASPAPKRPEPKRPAAAAPSTQATSTVGGPRRVKEVEMSTISVEATKDTKRRLMQRQDSAFRSTDYLKRELVHSTRKKKAASRPALKTEITTPAEHKRVVEMGSSITVSDLAKAISVKSTVLISKLMGMGVSATLNQSIDFDTASLVTSELGYEVKQVIFKEETFLETQEGTQFVTRAPIVTVMGHVDHGKTSLLDAIRKTDVAAGEAGGITQHIGAYTITLDRGGHKGRITFIDTPGHEAFTAMRARGAKVTDIVILVVSCTDGVMPQTLESVAHATAAEVPIIVALNKIDLPDANPDRIKQTLAGHGLNPEEWGGETLFVPVSAKTGKGIDKLLESVLLQAEMQELKAAVDVKARGTIIESKLDKSRGPIATVLIQQGVLKLGEVVISGTVVGKIRAIQSSSGEKIKEAGPSEAVEILGLSGVPNVGDELHVVADDKTAQKLQQGRDLNKKGADIAARPKLSLDEMFQTGTDKELRVILKTDAVGSSEALKEALSKLPQEKVKLKILLASTGGVSESDVMLASASGAVILGFNIRPDIKAQKIAEAEKVQIRTYGIIYELLDETKKLLEGLLDKQIKEKVIGRAEVRNVFSIPKIGTIAGSAVIDGKVARGCFLRLLRDSRIVYEGKISSLKRFKEDVREVQQGFECGIGLENFNDVKLGDQFEVFVKEEIQDKLL